MEQYKKDGLKFCKVRKGQKRPFEKDWVNQGYTWANIKKWVDAGNNYGVICGEGDLIVIDSDEPELAEAVDAGLPRTFRVKTGGGGYHDYYICPEAKKKIVLQNDKHYGEVQSYGAQVVAAGSTHPNGNKYKVIRDDPIREISLEQLMSCIKPFMKEVVETEKKALDNLKDYGESDINSIPLTKVIDTTGFRKGGKGEIYGANPWHGSTTGMNFWINPQKNVAHCFRCNAGINVAQAIALNEGIISNCTDKLTKSQFLDVLDTAKQKYDLPGRKMEENLQRNKINFSEDDWVDSWENAKARSIKLTQEKDDLFFISHNKDEIKGKAQLVQDTMQRIPMIIKVGKRGKDGNEISNYKFIDDRYDKRYDGYTKDVLTFNFWVYRVIDNGIEYYVFSQDRLNNEKLVIRGMNIELNNYSELTKTLKFRSLANVFILHKAFSSAQKLDKKELIKLTTHLKEEYKMEGGDFIDFLFTHPRDKKVYDHSETFRKIQIAQLLSGKYEGYPLHLLVMGPVGTGKTTYLECLHDKFEETEPIMEAGNSTPKALVPSFKEKPANPGHILKCVRLSLIDELMKMINNVSLHHNDRIKQALGKLNMLLEHKKRVVGSGNDNSIEVKATAKIIFATNPLPDCATIYQHVGPIDYTTLSRMLIWVQDEEHQEIIKKKNLKKLRPHIHKNIHVGARGLSLSMLGRNNSYKNPPQSLNVVKSLFDSAKSFLVEYNYEVVKQIFFESLNFCEQPMTDVWSSRGLHHCVLLLDGLVKYRCLFEDYDETFTPKKKDYKLLKKIVERMIKSWRTNISPKKRNSWIE